MVNVAGSARLVDAVRDAPSEGANLLQQGQGIWQRPDEPGQGCQGFDNLRLPQLPYVRLTPLDALQGLPQVPKARAWHPET